MGITPENIGAATVVAVNTAQSTANTAINNAATAQGTADSKANASHTHAASDVTSGTLPITRGGTGQTTAAGIRNALGLGNTTGALPVANGGTGATDAAAARSNLGAASAAAVTAAQSTADTALTNAASAQNTANTALANTQTLNTGKLDTGGNGSNVTAAFSQASTKANIATGEKLSVIFGKLMKWYASFGAAAWMGTGTTSSTVALGNHTHTAAAVGAVPTTRKVNGKALSADVTLTAPDVGARAEDWLPTLAQVGGSRPNLLINWDFRKPINQRNATMMTPASGYGIDMWLNVVGASVDICNGYLTLNATSVLTTKLPPELVPFLIGKVVTASYIDTDGILYSGSAAYPAAGGASAIMIDNADLQVYVPGGGNNLVQIYAKQTKSIVCVKLEIGLGSTLAYDPPPDPQQELAKCQRYFYRLNIPAYGRVGYINRDGNASLIAVVQLPVPLRANPTVAVSNPTNFYLESNSSVRPTAIAAWNPPMGTEMQLIVTFSSVQSGGFDRLRIGGSPEYINFDANL